MNERNAFLKILAENEDDTTARLIFADWLDEHGEHEEADRMRKWPTAKEWLVRFCQHNNPRDDMDPDERYITYANLIELGREAVEEADKGEIKFWCGNSMTMWQALHENKREFWKNWSIVTGIALPSVAIEKSSFRCGC